MNRRTTVLYELESQKKSKIRWFGSACSATLLITRTIMFLSKWRLTTDRLTATRTFDANRNTSKSHLRLQRSIDAHTPAWAWGWDWEAKLSKAPSSVGAEQRRWTSQPATAACTGSDGTEGGSTRRRWCRCGSWAWRTRTWTPSCRGRRTTAWCGTWWSGRGATLESRPWRRSGTPCWATRGSAPSASAAATAAPCPWGRCPCGRTPTREDAGPTSATPSRTTSGAGASPSPPSGWYCN